ncbi:RagB/SusD family nutrient uptake outer membrane protein [Pseudopedobacter beijingensis]|uniref:RagB/SusD family nutrient uptake outer membrane protein n=1 Tax=Pseudopedobacter beijingensis TaxID=1207056 RepID=A0ABW4IG97_9SPHI
MKKISNIFLSVCLLICCSCESVLDKEPITGYSYQNFWNEPAQASAALNGAYFRLQTTLNTEFITYGEARADNLDVKLYNAGTYALANNTLNADYAYTDWGNFYRVIGQVNLIIKNVQEMKAKGLYVNKDAEYNRILGQALGLRALCYLWMVKVWGNVPLVTDPVEYDGDINAFKRTRTDTLQVYNQISTDLLRAQPLLPASYTDNRKTRATLTKGAIDAMLTDYYMWRNKLDSALITSNRILSNTTQYKLANLYDSSIDFFSKPHVDIDNTEYAKMFIEGFSAESIFEIAFSYAEGTNSGLASLFGGGSAVVFYYVHPAFVSIFSSTDLRLRNNFKSESQIFKMFPKGTFDRAKENDKNVILYRLADIILLRAEALVLKGDLNGAWTLLKRVRERVFGVASATNTSNNNLTGPTGSTTESNFKAMTIADAHEVILEERRKELCFEGKRWFDLVRTGKAISKMESINGLKSQENILFPINLNIIRQNPLIEQNEYYK